jgi:hypothetical protein
VEMLRAMGTVAFQTVFGAREKLRREGGTAAEAMADDDKQVNCRPSRRPGLIDSCHALAADGEAVKQLWPEFYVERD